MFYGKFCWGLAFMLLAAGQSAAQRNSSLPGYGRSAEATDCRTIEVRVEDRFGVGIMGATVISEKIIMSVSTDSNGMAKMPCHSDVGAIPRVKVSAQGYMPVTTTIMPDSGDRMEIRLDRLEQETPFSGTIVTVGELSKNAQKRSSHFQEEAAKALADQKYDNAELLLMEAQRLTPSSASIMNNLGIVALHQKDFDKAGEWFQKAAAAAPHIGDIRGNLGLVRWMQDRKEESYNALSRAYDLGYESNFGNYILGIIGLGKGEYKEAVKLLKKVPANQFPYRNLYLSVAFRKCGNNKAADENYRNFLLHNPTPYYVSQLR
jgi:hypothetical protein